MQLQAIFGSINDSAKGGVEITGVEITGAEQPSRFLFSNMFEVTANARPWDRVVVAKNLECTIEVVRTEGKSP